MFVHGGISEDDTYLDDCHLLNFYPLKWTACSISLDGPSPCLAWHSACLILPADIIFHSKFNIYKLPEMGIGRRSVPRVNFIFILKNLFFDLLKIKSFYFRLKKEEYIYSVENHLKMEILQMISGFFV